MWKPLMAEEMLKSFDMRQRNSEAQLENYKWMVPNEFKNTGFYYNTFNKHHHLNPKHSKPSKYGYNRSEVLQRQGNLKSQHNLTGKVDVDFGKQIDDLENYVIHNRRGPVLERSYGMTS